MNTQRVSHSSHQTNKRQESYSNGKCRKQTLNLSSSNVYTFKHRWKKEKFRFSPVEDVVKSFSNGNNLGKGIKIIVEVSERFITNHGLTVFKDISIE
ncbi:CLUMA_CG017281, isoform A [Clunio marinus]|uniref:CLUMA_CG017281, isoform A n=1 Tax=Clunio marinus TaxID=568069 RepID=A0A1J1IVD5_9DIPT|nr:CLUMA_CG017281, isoform A [Clunio marinus]